jgi:hypothetical protein
MVELLHWFMSGTIVAEIDLFVTHVVNVHKMFALTLFQDKFQRK